MKISIITISYNSEATICDTLESIFKQSYSNFEHIVVDGQSKDNTIQKLKSFQDPRLTIISEPDHGIYDAMNKGLSLATGEVVGFLNSDDFFADTSSLENIAKAFSDKSVGACFADLVYVTRDKNRTTRIWRSKSYVKGNFAKGWCPPHPTFYVRNSIISRCGTFDLSFKLAADAEFMMRYLEKYRIKSTYIPFVLVGMRVGGISNQNWSNIVEQNKEIFLALKKNDIEYGATSFMLNKIINRAIQYLKALFRKVL